MNGYLVQGKWIEGELFYVKQLGESELPYKFTIFASILLLRGKFDVAEIFENDELEYSATA